MAGGADFARLRAKAQQQAEYGGEREKYPFHDLSLSPRRPPKHRDCDEPAEFRMDRPDCGMNGGSDGAGLTTGVTREWPWTGFAA